MSALSSPRSRFDHAKRQVDEREFKRTGYVYVARREGMPGYKVGFSTNPERRMLALRAELVGAVRGSYGLESTFHGVFHRQRIAGEWFDLSESDIAFILEMA